MTAVFDFRPVAEYQAVAGTYGPQGFFLLNRLDGQFLPRGISKVTIRDSATPGVSELDFAVNGEMTHIMMALPNNTANAFAAWAAKFSCTKVIDQRFAAVPKPVPASPAKSTCPVCYGTGYYKGFGAPCSKGCKP